MSDTTTVTTEYFTLESEWVDHLECYETAFAAVRYGAPLSMGVTPVVSPDVMATFVARAQMLRAAGEAFDFIQWDGNGVRVVGWQEDPTDDSQAFWLLPDADGNFDLAPLGYTFSKVDADDRIIRKVG